MGFNIFGCFFAFDLPCFIVGLIGGFAAAERRKAK
jgi:hypothetical protein